MQNQSFFRNTQNFHTYKKMNNELNDIDIGKELAAAPPAIIRKASLDDDLAQLIDKLEKEVDMFAERKATPEKGAPPIDERKASPEKRQRPDTPPTDDEPGRTPYPCKKKRKKKVRFAQTKTTNVNMHEMRKFAKRSGLYSLTFQNGHQRDELLDIIARSPGVAMLSKHDSTTNAIYGFERVQTLDALQLLDDRDDTLTLDVKTGNPVLSSPGGARSDSPAY